MTNITAVHNLLSNAASSLIGARMILDNSIFNEQLEGFTIERLRELSNKIDSALLALENE